MKEGRNGKIERRSGRGKKETIEGERIERKLRRSLG